ncbi:MAG: DNA polymerase V subunit UmuD [Rhodospirillaceae bacterium]|nr:DNA polymerase V subunit UmuD [Rhodospirillaceae bacterium]|tara:strand:- start:2157 stop:2585 length:429 start_codon:yes stop_codon:yes gene_type:complete
MKVTHIRRMSEESLSTIFVPYFLEPVYAGFPSPASDYIESPIDLNKHLIKNWAATFLVRARGHSMIGSGILDQSVLIVDRSIKPVHNSIVIASIDGEFVCKRLKLKPEICLMPDNPDYPPISINHNQDLEIIGTVTAAINKF